MASAPTETLAQAHVLLQNVRLQRIEFAIRNERKRSEAGYLTVNDQDVIKDADLRAALLLDRPRSRLIGQIFWRFIAGDQQSSYLLSRKCLRDTAVPQGCDLRMARGSNALFWVRLRLSRCETGDGSGVRLAINDITESKIIELVLKDKELELKKFLAK